MSVTDALGGYRASQGPRVLQVVEAARGRTPALDDRLAAAGRTDGVPDVAALERLPVLAKDDLPALQRGRPPLGGLLADGTRAVRLFASPGPIYEPQLAGEDPWRWTPALEACGIGPGDVVLNCFSYHLSPAGAMFDEGCRAVGAVVVPAGVGGQEVQAQVLADLGVTAFVGLPSYLAALVEAYDGLGRPAADWRVSKALVTAEPLPDALREQLRRRVDSVLMAYGTAEAGLIGFETTPGSGLRVPDSVYVEICEPGTGVPVAAGEPGEVVVSVLHTGYPLVRFGTGDVSRWLLTDGDELRLAGVLGRVGAAVKVRGLFVHPHQAAEVVGALRRSGVAAARFVVTRPADRDVLTLELVPEPGADPESLVARATEQTRTVLRVRPEVSLVDALDDTRENGGVLLDERSWS